MDLSLYKLVMVDGRQYSVLRTYPCSIQSQPGTSHPIFPRILTTTSIFIGIFFITTTSRTTSSLACDGCQLAARMPLFDSGPSHGPPHINR